MTAPRSLLFCCVLALLSGCGRPAPKPALLVYCAAIARQPMEAIAERYEAEHGVEIELQFGGSNTLLSQAEISQTGDLFLAADQTYIQRARERNLITHSQAVASTRPVVIAAPEVAGMISNSADLLSGNYRLALANPEAAAIGALSKRVFQRKQMWPAIEQAVESRGVFTPTVTGVANAIELAGADVGIVWVPLAVNLMVSKIEFDDFFTQEDYASLELAVLKSSNNPDAAAFFLAFVTEFGGQEFSGDGFGPAEPGE